MNINRLRALRAFRTNLMIILGFGGIVTGIWIITAHIWGPAIGAGAGAIAVGIAVLVMEALGEPPR